MCNDGGGGGRKRQAPPEKSVLGVSLVWGELAPRVSLQSWLGLGGSSGVPNWT